MAYYDIDYWTIGFLSLAKDMYDHGILNMDTCGNIEVCEDVGGLEWEGISAVFQDFKGYYHKEKQLETLVFRDPVITEFYRLCSLYEEQKSVSEEENPFRQNGERDVYECFRMDAYDYSLLLYDGSSGSPRLVFLYGEEFCGTGELPVSLAEARDTFEIYCERVKMALAEKDAGTPAQEIIEREAA